MRLHLKFCGCCEIVFCKLYSNCFLHSLSNICLGFSILHMIHTQIPLLTVLPSSSNKSTVFKMKRMKSEAQILLFVKNI